MACPIHWVGEGPQYEAVVQGNVFPGCCRGGSISFPPSYQTPEQTCQCFKTASLTDVLLSQSASNFVVLPVSLYLVRLQTRCDAKLWPRTWNPVSIQGQSSYSAHQSSAVWCGTLQRVSSVYWIQRNKGTPWIPSTEIQGLFWNRLNSIWKYLKGSMGSAGAFLTV